MYIFRSLNVAHAVAETPKKNKKSYGEIMRQIEENDAKRGGGGGGRKRRRGEEEEGSEEEEGDDEEGCV